MILADQTSPSSDRGGALAGVKVLDFSRVLAAPYAAQTLADFGADVIKVEHPRRGDDSRAFGQFRTDEDGTPIPESSMFVCANRNKRSITLDLSRPGGQRAALALAAQCDVVVENFIAGTIERYGLDYAQVRRVNPGVIYCSVTGYGQEGPYSRRPGYDAVFQATSGLMAVTGPEDGAPGGGPTKAGPSLVDIATGYNAAIGILTALFHRQRTGEGQHIDVALLDVAVAMQANLVYEHFMTGEQPARLGNTGNGGHPATVFECADGPIYISAGRQKHYENLCDVLGHPELKVEPQFVDNASRFAHRRDWNARVAPTLARWRKADLEAALIAAGVPCSAVNTYSEILSDPHARQRGIETAIESQHTRGSMLRLIANPVRLAQTPAAYLSGPPRLGQHTEEILRGMLGLSSEEIDEMRAAGDI